MVVAVNQPRQTESDLDKVLKALRIVGGVFDIKNTLDQAEIAKAAEARQQSEFETQERLRRGEFKSQAEFLASPLAERAILQPGARPLGQSAEQAQAEVGIGPIQRPADISIAGEGFGLIGQTQLKEQQKQQFEDFGTVSRQQLVNLFRGFKRAPEGKEEFVITTPEGEEIGLMKRDSIDQLTAAQLLSDTRAQQSLAEQQRQFDERQRQRELDRLSKERLANARKKAAEEAKIKKDAEKKKETIQNELKKASQDAERWKFTEPVSLLRELHKKFNLFGESDIEGVGGGKVGLLGQVSETAAQVAGNKTTQENRQNIGTFLSAMLQMRSGAALTEYETKRLKGDLGLGFGTKDETIRIGLRRAARTLYDKIRNFEAGLSKEALAEWRKKPGVVTSADPLFESFGGGADNRDIKGFLGK